MTDIASHHFATINGVRLHYVEEGSGPLVVLLHGFPEFWYSWRHQIPALAAAGFRVLAPDLRGYNESAKPLGVRQYDIDILRDDVVALIRQTGAERAHLVGHDWGGAIAWHVALTRPAVIERLAILNAPHPAAFFRELRTLAQLRKSWYVFFFQLPWLPEWFLRRRNFAFLDRTLTRDAIQPDALTAEDVNAYKRALDQPGALTATINYYRAALRRRPRKIFRELHPVDISTLLIWGERDRYLGVRLTEGLEQWVPNLRIERLLNASHWVQNDVPDRVNELLIEFLGHPAETVSP
jgi:pimeloyl-ACP methyl ester carboxylesterase